MRATTTAGALLATMPFLLAAGDHDGAARAKGPRPLQIEPAATAANRPPATRRGAAQPAGGGGVAGAAECTWNNGSPLDCFVQPAAQADPSYPFFAEVADDFTLIGTGSNPCRLTQLTIWVSQFNCPNDVCVDPATVFGGVHVTVYPDAANEPAGNPLPDGVGHDGGELVTQLIPIDLITVTELTLPITGTFHQLDIPLFAMDVPKNQRHWMAVAPSFAVFPQSSLMLSDTNVDQPARQHFDLIAPPGGEGWNAIGGNIANCPSIGTPSGAFRDVAMMISGEKPDEPTPPRCAFDCSTGPGQPNGFVEVTDLLELLAQWGDDGTCNQSGGDAQVTVVDLLDLLAAWGPCPLLPPANDDCPDKQVVFLGSNQVDLNVASASVPGPFCTGSNPDTWYCYTHSGPSGTVSVTTSIDVLVEASFGCGCPPGTFLDCARGLPLNGGIEALSVSSGQSYCIRLVNDRGLTEPASLFGTLDITLNTTPPNENCGQEITLSIGGGAVAGDTTGSAGGIIGPACPDPDFPQNTSGHWYEVIGPAGGREVTATVRTPLSSGPWDTVLSVYCGECSSPFGPLFCVGSDNLSDVQGADAISAVTWCAEAGVSYRLLVHTNNVGESGPYTIEATASGGCVSNPPVCEFPSPANDFCDDAIAFETVRDANGCFAYDTTFATTDGPASPMNICNDSGATQTVQDIWFIYTAECDGVLTATTCDDIHGQGAPDYDTDIVVYGPYQSANDIICNSVDLLANLAVCNDDDPDNPCGQLEFGIFSSTAQLVGVTTGEVYLVRVGGWQFEGTDSGTGVLCITCDGTVPLGACCTNAGATCTDDVLEADCFAQSGVWLGGQACIDITCPATPANDECADAIDLGAVPFIQVGFDNSTATAGVNGSPDVTCNPFGDSPGILKDLWYTWTANADGNATIETCTATLDTKLAVYDSTSCVPPAMSDIACSENDCFLSSTVTIPVNQGTTYLIRVGSWGTDAGSQGPSGGSTLTVTGP